MCCVYVCDDGSCTGAGGCFSPEGRSFASAGAAEGDDGGEGDGTRPGSSRLGDRCDGPTCVALSAAVVYSTYTYILYTYI